MNNITRILLTLAMGASCALAQLTTTNTTLSSPISAISAGLQQFCLVSNAGVQLPSVVQNSSYLFVDQEAVQITGQGMSANCYRVKRGQLGTAAASHNTGAILWVGQAAPTSGDPNRPFTGVFVSGRPAGACISVIQYSLPLLVAGGIQGGEVIDCTGPTGAQIWTTVNPLRFISVGVALASAATIAPRAYVTHVTGTTAINTVTVPPGLMNGGEIKLIPDALWSTTTAGNLAVATTAVIGKLLILTYDANTGKFYPSY